MNLMYKMYKYLELLIKQLKTLKESLIKNRVWEIEKDIKESSFGCHLLDKQKLSISRRVMML